MNNDQFCSESSQPLLLSSCMMLKFKYNGKLKQFSKPVSCVTLKYNVKQTGLKKRTLTDIAKNQQKFRPQNLRFEVQSASIGAIWRPFFFFFGRRRRDFQMAGIRCLPNNFRAQCGNFFKYHECVLKIPISILGIGFSRNRNF